MEFDVLWTFGLIFLMIFGLGLLIAGIFTVYFGSGKSRGIGAGMLIGGIAIALLVFLMAWMDMLFPHINDLWNDIIFPGLVFLSAAIVGILAAIGVFLLAIMKS
jgi:ABC-type enterobactin transport system permease subunit